MNNLVYQVQKTANGQIGYCKVGHGRPLVLIVGYSGTLYHWNRNFVAKLAEHFTVYLVDNRYIGQSQSDNDYSLVGMARDIIDFIQALDLAKPLLFGWSMGGMLVQTILTLEPGLSGGAVLLATVPHASYTSQEFVNLVANSEQIPVAEFRKRLYGMFFSEKPREELKEFITQSALAIADYNYRFTFDAKQLQDYAVASWRGIDRQEMAQIQVPVLILRARDDQVVSLEASQILAQTIANAKLIIYPSGGHFFVHRNPIQLAMDVVNFFS